MKHFLMVVYQVRSNKSPGVYTGPAPGAYVQVSDFRAIMAPLVLITASRKYVTNEYLSVFC
jgi:hypothetical protein